jgi:hypothetical protein
MNSQVYSQWAALVFTMSLLVSLPACGGRTGGNGVTQPSVASDAVKKSGADDVAGERNGGNGRHDNVGPTGIANAADSEPREHYTSN